jgi:hypothetical protein
MEGAPLSRSLLGLTDTRALHRQLLETLSTLPLPVLSSLTTTTPSAAKNDADVEMDQ